MARLGKSSPLFAESNAMPAFSSDALDAKWIVSSVLPADWFKIRLYSAKVDFTMLRMCRLMRMSSFPSESALTYKMSSAYSNALKAIRGMGAPSTSTGKVSAPNVSTLGISISRPAAANLLSMSDVAAATYIAKIHGESEQPCLTPKGTLANAAPLVPGTVGSWDHNPASSARITRHNSLGTPFC
eukprot:5456432-Amphidinium_carterae.3